MTQAELSSRMARIAVVDGHAHHRAQVCTALQPFYHIDHYADCDEAWQGMRAAPPFVVLVDEKAPPLGGFGFVRKLRQDPAFRSLPLMCMTSTHLDDLPPDLRDGAVAAFLPKPFRRNALLKGVSSLINCRVEAHWETLPPHQRDALKRTLAAFDGMAEIVATGAALDYDSLSGACAPLVTAVNNDDFGAIMAGVRDHDNYCYAHSLRSATLLTLFGKTLGLSSGERAILASGGLVHDVGKMRIPHDILNKPGKLSDDDWVVMRGHVGHTVEYLATCATVPKGVLTIAATHHERLDGSGYPYGLDGSQLNILARMAAIVDVFGALTDRRVYKPAMPAEAALKIMTDDMGGHLDQSLVGAFREVFLDVIHL